MSTLGIASPQSTKQTILAVDDDKAIVHLCAEVLERAGFSVLSATNSSEALKICKNHPGPIHLLLADLVLPPPEFSFASGDNEFPNVHGHELAVRALRMRKDLRVILMSGNIDQELAGYGIRRGVVPFLPKPLAHQALVALVRQTLHAPPPSVESLTAGPTGIPKSGDEWVD
jgi:DNA-binding NtrC family response regulator